MTPLLADPAAERQLDRDGFLVTPLFTPEEVDSLVALYRRHVADAEVSGLYESSRNKPFEVNRAINEAIQAHVAHAGAGLFRTPRIYGGTFMIKAPADSEVLPLHQDWSVVEEDRFRTLFVWCPLVEVTVRNGCLFVLPGSHRYFTNLRSGSYPSNRYLLPAQLQQHVVDVPLRAGEAILYFDALFHGSHANNGTAPRIVVTARLMEEEAPLVYFHKANDREVDVYEASPELYLTHIDSLAKGLMPAGAQRLHRRSYTHVEVTGASLERAVRQHAGDARERCPMTQLFRDPARQAQFERDGFLVIDLLDDAQVADLREFYGGLRNAAVPSHGFQVSLDNESPAFVQGVSERLVETVRSRVDRHFHDHRIFTASFVTKERNPRGVVPPHQDWTFVDESRYWSATIWCPLVDVGADNGALGLIKGSHRFYDHVRPSPSPQYSPPFKDQLRDIFPFLTLVTLKAGQALVFDNRTLHASPPNTTDETRVAFGIGITHRDAALRHYYLLPGRQDGAVEAYEVEPDFFFSYNNARLSAMHARGEKPQGLNSIGLFLVRHREYSTPQLLAAMRDADNEENRALVERMTALFPEQVGGASMPAVAAAPPLPFWKVYTPMNVAREINYRIRRRF